MSDEINNHCEIKKKKTTFEPHVYPIGLNDIRPGNPGWKLSIL